MNEHGDEWHTVNPPIEEAEEIPYDRSQMGPGIMVIEVEFDRTEINRLKRGLDRKTRITRFIKETVLAEADRLAAEREKIAQAD